MSTEQDLNDQKIETHYQALPKDQPPLELDARILQAAHQAVRPEPARVVKLHRHKPAMPWLKPVSYAAVMVLSLGVVLHIQTEIPQTIKAHPETFYFPPGADEAVEVYPVKELQQAERPAPVAASAPADRILQEAPASPDLRPQQAARSKMAESAAPMENKAAKKIPEMDRMQAIGATQMLDADNVVEPPAAAIARVEKPNVSAEHESVERTVAEMMRLYQAGDMQKLKPLINKFVNDFPEYVLPKELQNVVRASSAAP